MKIYEAVETALLLEKGENSFLSGYTANGTQLQEHFLAFDAHARYVAVAAIANVLGLKPEALWEQYNAQRRIVEGT